MQQSFQRLATIKRALPAKRELQMNQVETPVSPLIEKAARAISDWHSERDWELHVDQAKRTVEAISEILHREGYRDAAEHLRSMVWSTPAPRKTV